MSDGGLEMADILEFVPRLPADESAYDAVKVLTVPQMKRVWDSWSEGGALDFSGDDPGCFILEAVHHEMNMRGEGSYVAV
jgi:hypothetical protein